MWIAVTTSRPLHAIPLMPPGALCEITAFTAVHKCGAGRGVDAVPSVGASWGWGLGGKLGPWKAREKKHVMGK